MARTLISRGATPSLRANVRKDLDWRATPAGTPRAWVDTFPERRWVNAEAFSLPPEI